MTQSQHKPWNFEEIEGNDYANGGSKAWRYDVTDANGEEVCELVADNKGWGTREEKREKAAFIVKAVNEYEQNQLALEDMRTKAADYAFKLGISLKQNAELEKIVQDTINEMEQRGQKTWAKELTTALAKAKGV